MSSITTADVVDDGTGDRANLIRQIAEQAKQIAALEARVGELMDVSQDGPIRRLRMDGEDDGAHA